VYVLILSQRVDGKMDKVMCFLVCVNSHRKGLGVNKKAMSC
jgi:hypothetical protein